MQVDIVLQGQGPFAEKRPSLEQNDTSAVFMTRINGTDDGCPAVSGSVTNRSQFRNPDGIRRKAGGPDAVYDFFCRSEINLNKIKGLRRSLHYKPGFLKAPTRFD